jgi:hypothetical protein
MKKEVFSPKQLSEEIRNEVESKVILLREQNIIPRLNTILI